MELQHYNKLESVLWFVEKLIREIDELLNSKQGIYSSVDIDLDETQANAVRKHLKDIYDSLEEAKHTLGLKSKQVKLSNVINVNTSFIWESIEDTWSSKMERKSGRIRPESKKQEMDKALRKILDLSNKIREDAGKENL